jgi:NADH dehydrogenase
LYDVQVTWIRASIDPMRLAVTGANGWLGRGLVRAVSGAGDEVVGVVRSAEGAEVISAAGGRPELVVDLEPQALSAAISGCSAVVHLAGISAERRGATYAAANIAGMQKVLEAARQAGVSRVIFFSGLGVAHYGMRRRTTNGYFLAKLAAEVELFRSGLEAVVFRPSYVVGPDDELVPALLAEMASGAVEIVGDGAYRLQPIALEDVCRIVRRVASTPLERPLVIDLVGPEAVAFRAFVERLARAASATQRAGAMRLREVPYEQAERAAAAGGYRGLLPDELDVLLCDETADATPARTWLGEPLTPLDRTIQLALRGSTARSSASFRR